MAGQKRAAGARKYAHKPTTGKFLLAPLSDPRPWNPNGGSGLNSKQTYSKQSRDAAAVYPHIAASTNGLTCGQLGRLTGLDPSSVSNACRFLRDRGGVERVPNTSAVPNAHWLYRIKPK